VRICAAVDGGGMIVDASTVGGVAAIVARQLRYEFFFFHRSLRVGRLLPSLIRWRPGRWWMLRPHSCAPRKKRLEDKIERLRTQNIEAIRDKSTAENKSRNLLDKVDTLEKENEGLNCQLSELKDIVVQSQSEAQSARAEAQAVRERVAELELETRNTRTHHERVEATTRTRHTRSL
jgi:regulator of replication initiation timing